MVRDMYIKKIKITNCYCFEHLLLEFPSPYAGWHTLIGDNGSGKTALIKASNILRLSNGFFFADSILLEDCNDGQLLLELADGNIFCLNINKGHSTSVSRTVKDNKNYYYSDNDMEIFNRFILEVNFLPVSIYNSNKPPYSVERIFNLLQSILLDCSYQVNEDLICEQEGYIFIDSPESYLSPENQCKLGGFLTKHFPNYQFIVTTGSPFVCRDSNTIWQLRNSMQLSKVDKGRIIYGNILDALGTELFGASISQSEASQEIIKELAALNVKSFKGTITPDDKFRLNELRAILPTCEVTQDEKDKILYGNVLDAYGTELFGRLPVRSSKSHEKLARLGRLNLLAALGKISSEEESERMGLQRILQTDDPI